MGLEPIAVSHRGETMPEPVTTVNGKRHLLIQDMLTNHLPRIEEGLRKGYVDENQILVLYDHAVRARVLGEERQ